MIFSTGEIYWMTGVIAVAVVYGIFALAWSKGGPDDE
jgi:hypothetical protein